jgi:hypothetical protein
MTAGKPLIQYNVAIKDLRAGIPNPGWGISNMFQGYKEFTDGSGNLDRTAFSRETWKYGGEFVVIKTLKPEVVDIVYTVLRNVKGLIVLPMQKCRWEDPSKSRRKSLTVRVG